jgi:predicted acylesterase/phospholipase RssA
MATFEDVQRAERKELQGVRERAPGTRLPDKTVGLAFSGGGIRSATFHLGVLQELAEHGLLKQVDYLSTVSGGGFIGSWLARWIREQGMAKVEEALPSDAQEAPEVNFLRDYSNYLTPRVGLLGADTWAAIALYLRNLLLNQAVLITFLSGILVIPWIVSASFECLENGYYDGAKLMVFSIVAAVLIIFAIAYGVLNTSTCSGGEQREFAQPKKVLLFVVAPIFGGAVLLSYALWSYPAEWTPFCSIVAGMTVYTAGHLAGWIAARIANAGNPSWAPQFSNVLWALPAGFFAGYEVYALSFIVYRWKANPNHALGVWHAVSWGAPLIVLAFLLAGTLHIGLAKFALRNQMQEWWARLGGWLMLWALFWCALFGMALFTPLLAKVLLHYAWAKRAVAAAWAVHSGYGALLGWGKSTSGKPPDAPQTTKSPIREVVAKAAPFVFVTGVLVLLACAVESFAAANGGVDLSTGRYRIYWFVVAFTILITISLFLSWRVDINRFSMNLLYRNRIIRCYLGASNAKRQPQPFTGFDPADDILLASFVKLVQEQGGTHSGSSSELTKKAQPYNGPYPILNATLDISHGGRLAWQERKAEAFMFTPHYCGYEFPEMKPEINRMEKGRAKKDSAGAYQETDAWGLAGGGISLGTAVSISGAAVSPNMGYHTYAPLAFLMTVFNVRLGEWLANPRYLAATYKPWLRPDGGPALSLLYLINELLGSATDSSKFVYLSDGAHFENLALYELVRRECDFIIAGDAGEDPGPGFEDLVNAIRKCRTDLGAEIELDTDPFKILGLDGYATAHAVFGTITYPSKKVGKLLYIKCSVTKNDPADVLAYKRAHNAFPHESTADQWFDESQFESYRMLGRCSIRSVISPAKAPSDIPDLFT